MSIDQRRIGWAMRVLPAIASLGLSLPGSMPARAAAASAVKPAASAAKPAASAVKPAASAVKPAASAAKPAASAVKPPASAQAAKGSTSKGAPDRTRGASAAADGEPNPAKSLRVQVLYVAAAGQKALPAADAVVRLQGSDQTFTTNPSGVAEVFGALDGKSHLTVIVVNASICNLPLGASAGAGKTLTVVVPRRGQDHCRFGS